MSQKTLKYNRLYEKSKSRVDFRGVDRSVVIGRQSVVNSLRLK